MAKQLVFMTRASVTNLAWRISVTHTHPDMDTEPRTKIDSKMSAPAVTASMMWALCRATAGIVREWIVYTLTTKSVVCCIGIILTEFAGGSSNNDGLR